MLAKHDVDVVSLVIGLLFVAAAAYWGLVDRAMVPGRGWFLPALLIVVGAIGLLGARTKRSDDW